MKKKRLKQDMQEVYSNISISFNFWTLPNYLVILGIIGYFINKDGKQCMTILGLCELIGEHLGENIVDILLQIFKNYKINRWIRYFMTNNASSNDTCINTILQAIYSNILDIQQWQHQFYCFGYIVNLCTQLNCSPGCQVSPK